MSRVLYRLAQWITHGRLPVRDGRLLACGVIAQAKGQQSACRSLSAFVRMAIMAA